MRSSLDDSVGPKAAIISCHLQSKFPTIANRYSALTAIAVTSDVSPWPWP